MKHIDAPPSSSISSKMQSEDFAQFTSFVDAYLRANEDAHEDRVYHDPFAEPLTRQIASQLTPRLHKWKELHPKPENYVAIRGRYLDEALAQRNSNIRQVVLLGAGLDTRVYRLNSLNGCHVLELDQSAQLFEHKRVVLSEFEPKLLADRHSYVVADLNAFNWEENLLSSGFDPDIPTFWALEGVMMFLTRASNLALIKTIDVLSAPGSEIWGDMAGCGLMQDGGLNLFKDVDKLHQKELGKQLFQHAEDDVLNGVFSELPWDMEVQAALEKPGRYFGREWTPAFTGTKKLPVTFTLVLARKPLDK